MYMHIRSCKPMNIHKCTAHSRTAQFAIAKPRDAYRELIECSLIFLVQAAHHGFHSQAPGPITMLVG